LNYLIVEFLSSQVESNVWPFIIGQISATWRIFHSFISNSKLCSGISGQLVVVGRWASGTIMAPKDTCDILRQLRTLMQNVEVTGGVSLAAYIVGSGDAHSVRSVYFTLNVIESLGINL